MQFLFLLFYSLCSFSVQSEHKKNDINSTYFETSKSGREFLERFDDAEVEMSDLPEEPELSTGVVVTELLLDQFCEKVRTDYMTKE